MRGITFLGITPVSSVSNGLYFLTLPLVNVMRVTYRKMRHARYLSKNTVIRRMRFACWITQVYRYIHSEYVILIAFPQQQRLRERASLSRLYANCAACYETGCVYCAVRTESLNAIEVIQRTDLQIPELLFGLLLATT